MLNWEFNLSSDTEKIFLGKLDSPDFSDVWRAFLEKGRRPKEICPISFRNSSTLEIFEIGLFSGRFPPISPVDFALISPPHAVLSTLTSNHFDLELW